MTKKRLPVMGVILAAVCAALLFAGGANTMAAAPSCTCVGTWYGQSDNGFTWIEVITPGTNATSGQVSLHWVLVDPTFGGRFPEVVKVTDAYGVWEKVNRRNTKFTWLVYGLDATGAVIFVGRVSGTDAMDGCNSLMSTYVLEVFLPGQDMTTDEPVDCGTGTSVETRVALVQATCDQPPQ